MRLHIHYVFEKFFASFGRKTSEFLTLKRLDPPYRLFLADGRPLDVPDKIPEVEALFERLQPGGRSRLEETHRRISCGLA